MSRAHSIDDEILESQAHGGRGQDEVVGIGPDLIALSGELVHLGSDEGGEVGTDAAFPGSVAYGVRPTMQLRVADYALLGLVVAQWPNIAGLPL